MAPRICQTCPFFFYWRQRRAGIRGLVGWSWCRISCVCYGVAVPLLRPTSQRVMKSPESPYRNGRYLSDAYDMAMQCSASANDRAPWPAPAPTTGRLGRASDLTPQWRAQPSSQAIAPKTQDVGRNMSEQKKHGPQGVTSGVATSRFRDTVAYFGHSGNSVTFSVSISAHA